MLLAVIIGMTGWATLARLLRAETMKLSTLDFVSAAKALGVNINILNDLVHPPAEIACGNSERQRKRQRRERCERTEHHRRATPSTFTQTLMVMRNRDGRFPWRPAMLVFTVAWLLMVRRAIAKAVKIHARKAVTPPAIAAISVPFTNSNVLVRCPKSFPAFLSGWKSRTACPSLKTVVLSNSRSAKGME